MALPTFVAVGTKLDNAASAAVSLPAGLQTNDILLLCVETANQAVTVSNQNGGTWTEVTGSPQGTGTAAGASSTRLTVFWSRYNGTQGNPTISDSGDHQIAVIAAFRGCPTTGDPWNTTSGSIDATSDTSLSATGATTTVNDCLVVIISAIMDNTGFGSTWTNASLASITARADVTGIAGNDGEIAVITGTKATAGAYGATTNTLLTASTKGMLTIALAGASSDQTITPTASLGTWVTPIVSLLTAATLVATPAQASFTAPVAALQQPLAATPATAPWTVPVGTLIPGVATLAATPATDVWTAPSAAILPGAVTLPATPATRVWTSATPTVQTTVTLSGGATSRPWTSVTPTLATTVTVPATAAVRPWTVPASSLQTAVSVPATPATTGWAVPAASLFTGLAVPATPATSLWTLPSATLQASATMPATAATQVWTLPSATLQLTQTLTSTAASTTWTLPTAAVIHSSQTAMETAYFIAHIETPVRLSSQIRRQETVQVRVQRTQSWTAHRARLAQFLTACRRWITMRGH